MSEKHNTIEAIEYLLTALETSADADDYWREISDLRATLKKVTLVVHQPSYKEPSKLAFKIANAIADLFAVGFCNDRMVEDFAEVVEKHLPRREPLSDKTITELWGDKHSSKVRNFAKAIEKAHCITGDKK